MILSSHNIPRCHIGDVPWYFLFVMKLVEPEFNTVVTFFGSAQANSLKSGFADFATVAAAL